MILSLAGCLFIDDELHATRVAELSAPAPAPTTPFTPSTLDPPVVTAVDPPFGVDSGGTQVTLTGGPFASGDPALEVRFGEAVGAIVSVSNTSVVVETAPAAVGKVPLTVVTSGGEVVVPSAYTYWADATGLVGATGELRWFFIVGGYWAPGMEDYGSATLRFVEPLAYNFYENWAPELDTCTRVFHEVPEYEFDPPIVSIDALGGTATETSPSSEVVLDWKPDQQWFANANLDPEQVTPGETYDLSLRGTIGVPEIDLAGVFPVPARFEMISPNIHAQNLPDISAGQHFEWTTEEDGDAFILQIGMLNENLMGFEEELYCAVSDVGSFWLDENLWTVWEPGRQVHILAARYNGGNGLLPWNNGRIATASQVWLYGAARSR